MSDLVARCLIRVFTERSPTQDLGGTKGKRDPVLTGLFALFIREKYCLLVPDYTTVSATEPKKLGGFHKGEMKMIGGGHSGAALLECNMH